MTALLSSSATVQQCKINHFKAHWRKVSSRSSNSAASTRLQRWFQLLTHIIRPLIIQTTKKSWMAKKEGKITGMMAWNGRFESEGKTAESGSCHHLRAEVEWERERAERGRDWDRVSRPFHFLQADVCWLVFMKRRDFLIWLRIFLNFHFRRCWSSSSFSSSSSVPI